MHFSSTDIIRVIFRFLVYVTNVSSSGSTIDSSSTTASVVDPETNYGAESETASYTIMISFPYSFAPLRKSVRFAE